MPTLLTGTLLNANCSCVTRRNYPGDVCFRQKRLQAREAAPNCSKWRAGKIYCKHMRGYEKVATKGEKMWISKPSDSFVEAWNFIPRHLQRTEAPRAVILIKSRRCLRNVRRFCMPAGDRRCRILAKSMYRNSARNRKTARIYSV